jgi:putative membrane protein
MRYIRYAFMGALALCLIAVALANRQVVALKLLPEGLAEIVGLNHSIETPLFLVIFAGILAGLLIGFVWEWLREYKHRAEAATKTAEAARLEKELHRVKRRTGDGRDEVLALLDDGR